MIELGQLLQQTRIAQELTLSDVEAQTRIRQEYLEALEQDQWERLPNPAVAKGFLRTYARFLKIESHPQVQAVFSPLKMGMGKSAPEPAIAPGSYLPVEISLGKSGDTLPRALRTVLRLLLVLIPVLALAFVLVKYGLPVLLNAPQPTPDTATVGTSLPPTGAPASTPLILVGATGTPEPTATPTLPSTYTPTPRPTAPPRPTDTLTPSPTPFQQLTLTLQISQRSWVRIITDGEVQLEEILEPGDQRTFIAENWLEMRTGNAAGVTLVLNGQSLGPFGKPGEIVDYVWTLNAGEIQRRTPTPEPTDTPEPPAASSEVTSTTPLSDTTTSTNTSSP